MFLLILLLSLSHLEAFSNNFRFGSNSMRNIRNLNMAVDELSSIGGGILVTGIGNVDEDEFMLNLLHEQEIWNSVKLGYPDAIEAKKRFLSRTARYSGLLNVLDFIEMDVKNSDKKQEDVIRDTLKTSNAWIAFNLTQTDIPRMTSIALESDISRVIFTMHLPSIDINNTAIPELDQAVTEFEKAGKVFTGIRHGDIIKGDEDNAYEIVNATIPCMEPIVERGVLARVTAELLLTPESGNEVCGISSSSSFAAAYLNVLRSSGLTRRQEIKKMFSGGLQRVARMTVKEYEAQAQKEEEERERKEKRRIEKEKEAELEAKQAKLLAAEAESRAKDETEGKGGSGLAVSFDEEQDEPEITDEEKINIRVKEILQNVWVEMDARMYAKSTSKREFFDANREKAITLAKKELEDEKVQKKENLEEKRASQNMLAQMVEVNRKQYSKLLALERKEMENQKVISDTWVKYIYLLIETTLKQCDKDGVLFHNMDEFGQTMTLRNRANELRTACGLSTYDVIYDPLDASAIIAKMEKSEGLEDTEYVINQLNTKHGKLLENVSALRGASQIIELAIKTLSDDLPPPPPSVDEIRRTESASKQAAVSEMRLDAIKKRGQPNTDAETSVGRL